MELRCLLNESALPGVSTSMSDGVGSCINECLALACFALAAASCVADDQPGQEQTSLPTETLAPTSTTSEPPLTTTSVAETEPIETERQPTEIRLAPGWQTIAEFDDDFLVRSLAEVDGVLFVVGGGLNGSDPVETQSLYVIDPALDEPTVIPWGDSAAAGDVASIDGAVVVLSSNGLWRIDPVTLSWSQAEDGDWSGAVAFADQLLRLDGTAWTPASGILSMAPAPFGVPRPTASWIELGDDVFLLDRGFWQYVATSDEWRELQRPSLASAAMAITRVGNDVVAADYQMKAQRWNQLSERWEELPDLPLRSAECLPRPVSSMTFAGFVMCTGIAVWRLDGWVTIPAGPDGVPFAESGSMFVADAGRITRYLVQVDAAGPLAGPTIPVGASLLDIPTGWSVQRQEVVRWTEFNDGVGETLIADTEGGRCTLTTAYVGMAQARGELIQNRRGQPTRIETLGTGVLVSDTDGSDIVEIQCGNPADVMDMASRLWRLWRPITARWLDPGPLQPRGGHSVIWSGDEMIVWGGRTDEDTSSSFNDGAAYNQATQTWRMLASTELGARYDHIAVWTGSEMLIVGGSDGAASYDPTIDAWRPLPDAPFAVNRNVGWAWSSGQLIVWQPRTDQVAAFDPEFNEWTTLPPTGLEPADGVLRSGQGTVVALAVVEGSESEIASAVWDELTGTWRPLPDFVNGGSFPATPLDLIVTSSVRNGRLLVWNQAGLSAATSLVAPEWQVLDAIAIDTCEGTGQPIDQDDLLVAISWCGADAVFNDLDLSWQSIELPGWGDRYTTVWTGTELLSWGDTCCYGTGGAPFTVDPWKWTPPPTLFEPNE